MLQIVVSLTDNSRDIIYDRKIFILPKNTQEKSIGPEMKKVRVLNPFPGFEMAIFNIRVFLCRLSANECFNRTMN
jgi:hypothetical protein